MTLVLPTLYHWTPTANRTKIRRRGLVPRTETAVWVRPTPPDQHKVGHVRVGLFDETLLCVCLGTTPSTAWALSGAINGERGTSYDCWEIDLEPTDETHMRPTYGHDLDEIRVANRIPPSQLWLIGARQVAPRGTRWRCG